MNLSSRYERPDAPLRHRTEINHNRSMLTQFLQKCQIALEIPDEDEEASGQLPRLAFKDHLCRYHAMARQDEVGVSRFPLCVSTGLLMDWSSYNAYDGSVSRMLCVDFGGGQYQAARGNHGHSQLHTHDNFGIINEITQDDIDRWNAGDSGAEVGLTRTITVTVENPVRGDSIPLLALPASLVIESVYAFVSNGNVTGDIRYGRSMGAVYSSIFTNTANKLVTSINEFADCGTMRNPSTQNIFPPRCLWLYIENVTGTPRAVTYSISYSGLGLKNV